MSVKSVRACKRVEEWGCFFLNFFLQSTGIFLRSFNSILLCAESCQERQEMERFNL